MALLADVVAVEAVLRRCASKTGAIYHVTYTAPRTTTSDEHSRSVVRHPGSACNNPVGFAQL